MPVGSCLTDDLVAEFVEGRLEGERLSSAEEHVSSCDPCAELIAAVAGTRTGGASPEPMELATGAHVGRYVLLDAIGAGGMGTVYAAHDPSLDRKVALKLVRADRGGPQLEKRLLREAKAMARLAHPDVITVFDAGMHGGQLFIAMELVDGGTLRQWVAQERRPWRVVLEMFLHAGRGLSQAHAGGIVHRDFKPDNVLVGRDGRVRVTDFGLARVVRDEAPDEDSALDGMPNADREATSQSAILTRTGMLVGTPAYMAPEQFGGAHPDVRSDIFSFSVSVYEALYGERPFSGKSMRDLLPEKRADRVRPPPPGSQVPTRLRRALLVGLRANPAERYASMDECLAALVDATRPARSPTLAGATGLVAVVIASIVAIAAWRGAFTTTPTTTGAPQTTQSIAATTPASSAPAPEPIAIATTTTSAATQPSPEPHSSAAKPPAVSTKGALVGKPKPVTSSTATAPTVTTTASATTVKTPPPPVAKLPPGAACEKNQECATLVCAAFQCQ